MKQHFLRQLGLELMYGLTQIWQLSSKSFTTKNGFLIHNSYNRGYKKNFTIFIHYSNILEFLTNLLTLRTQKYSTQLDSVNHV